MRLSFQVAFLVLAAAVSSVAQDASPEMSQTTASECTVELIEDAEQSFERRKFGSENLARAERQLSKVVRLCQETVGAFQAQVHLRVAQEELADRDLSLALFYLGRFNDGKGGKAGALSRLKSISEAYPEYSRLDQVLFLLAEINMNDRNLDEAIRYYQRLIGTYPGSQYTGAASLQLSAIDVWKIYPDSQPSP